MNRTRVRHTAALVGALLVVGLGAACTSEVNGEAKPDPALAVARATTSATASTTTTRPTTTTTAPTTTASLPVVQRKAVCAQIPLITSAATKAVNDYLTVANAATAVTPELVAAENTAVGLLTPLPQRLRTVPGVDQLPADDLIVVELPLIASSVDAVIAAIPQRKKVPFNAATDDYNGHLDKIRTSCTS